MSARVLNVDGPVRPLVIWFITAATPNVVPLAALAQSFGSLARGELENAGQA